jgi:benzoyl-CoA reductase/2-hydroxyglutaryl-CoA dehydratase subunit BcrC/BadD/HgdB
MVNITIQIDDETHIKLLEMQLDRKRKKIEPTAINKIASEKLKEAMEKQGSK